MRSANLHQYEAFDSKEEAEASLVALQAAIAVLRRSMKVVVFVEPSVTESRGIYRSMAWFSVEPESVLWGLPGTEVSDVR